MADQPIVIVGSDGTEHEFPAAMNPKKAAEIVRAHEAHPQFGDPSLHPTEGAITDTPEQGSWKDKLGRAMASLAHPTTLTDIGNLVLAPTDVTRGAIANIPTALRAARDMKRPIGETIEATGRYVQKYNILHPQKPLGDAIEAIGSKMSSSMPKGVERYAPNIGSGSSAVADTAATVKGPAQATYTQLADGSWGIKGSGLKAGESVHVMNRAGNGSMQTVGKVLPDGTATIQGATGSLAGPKIALSSIDVIRIKQLVAQGIPEQAAVETVLKIKAPTGSLAGARQ